MTTWDCLVCQQHNVGCSAGLWGLSTFHVAAGLSLAITLPMLLIPTFQKLSWLNLMGFLSTALVTATVMAAAVSDPGRSKQHQVPASHPVNKLVSCS